MLTNEYANQDSIQEDVAVQQIAFDIEKVYEAHFGFIKDQNKFLIVRLVDYPSELYRMYITEGIMHMLYAMIMKKQYAEVSDYTVVQFIDLLKAVATKAHKEGKTLPTIKVLMHQLGRYWVANLYVPNQHKVKPDDVIWF